MDGGSGGYGSNGGSPGGGGGGAGQSVGYDGGRGQIRITYEVAAADTTAPTITTSAIQTVAENSTFSITLAANEAVTWTKAGGDDQALFTLSGSTLSMTAKDFEAPVDADENNVYVVAVRATDAAGNWSEKALHVEVTNVADTDTTPPTITSSATPSVAENTVDASGNLTANEAVTWSKVGGADAGAFTLVGSNWTLNVTPDYETKTSYVVIWRATDAAGNATNQTMTLSITDVSETPPDPGPTVPSEETFVCGPLTTTWDTGSYKSYEFILSSENRVAHHNRGYNASGSVLGSQGITTGDHSFSVMITKLAGTVAMGVTNKNRPLGTTLGWSVNDASIQNNGDILIQNVNHGNIGAMEAGSIVEVRVRNQRLYARRDGGNWNGSPTVSPDAGNGPSIASISGPIFPVVFGSTSGLQFVGHFSEWNTDRNFAFTVQPGETSITLAGHGAGGGGAGANTGNSGMGGAGGAFSGATVSVTGGDQIEMVLGGGGAFGLNSIDNTGAKGFAGGDTIVRKNGTIVLRAKGGGAGFWRPLPVDYNDAPANLGGQASAGIGTNLRSGGRGWVGGQYGTAGAGGGAASPTGNGADGNYQTGGAAGPGAAAATPCPDYFGAMVDGNSHPLGGGGGVGQNNSGHTKRFSDGGFPGGGGGGGWMNGRSGSGAGGQLVVQRSLPTQGENRKAPRGSSFQ
ncbi:hypothetical protein [Brevundimonas sp. NPDC058933]|uniref:glycine-rich domain-containing protein n=1 Tax=Brevundimonas sp. NPDC058933 TaxID=3346673 RepID=UPI003BEF456E